MEFFLARQLRPTPVDSSRDNSVCHSESAELVTKLRNLVRRKLCLSSGGHWFWHLVGAMGPNPLSDLR